MAKQLGQVKKSSARHHLSINCQDSELLEEIVHLLEISLGDYNVEKVDTYVQGNRNGARVYLKIDKIEDDGE